MPPVQPLQLMLEIVRAGPLDDHPDLDLHDLGPRDYRIRIGSAFVPAVLDWDPALLADLASLRRSGSDPEVLHRLGARLRRFLRDTDWPRHEADLLAALDRKAAVHFIVSADADEMYALPWDLLALDSSGQHLGELPGVLVRYAWPRSRAPMSSAASGAGSILMAWSAAAGQVPAADHIRTLRRACGRRSSVFDEHRDVLPHVSWGRLQDALHAAAANGRPVRVLHILCHGVRRGRGVCLAWNDDDDGDGLAIIDGGRLRQLLTEHAPELRLVILCACDSSNEALLGAHLGSLARSLHRVGIQTVIGSAVPLSARGSITFTERFYRALVNQQASPAQAFVTARHGLARHVRTHDWLALRFYCQPEEGVTQPIVLPAPPWNRLGRRLPWLVPGMVGAALVMTRSTTSDRLVSEHVPPAPVHASLHAVNDAGVHRPLAASIDKASSAPAADAQSALAPPSRAPLEDSPARSRHAMPASPRVYRVVVLIPSFMDSPEILVDGQPAKRLKTLPTAVTIQTTAGNHRITIRTPRHSPCEDELYIHEDEQVVMPCAQ